MSTVRTRPADRTDRSGRGERTGRGERPGPGAAAATGSSVTDTRDRPWSRAWFGQASADLRMALSHAVGAVVIGLVACVGLVVAGWAMDASSGTPWPQAVRLGADLWLLAHLGDLAVLSEVVGSPVDEPTTVAGVLSLAPLGGSLLVALLAWRAGRRAAQRTAPVRSLVLCLVVAGVYGGVAFGVAWAADTVVVTPSPLACALGAAAWSGLAALVGALGVHAGTLLDRLPRAAEDQVRRVVPAVAVVLGTWLLAGAVLLSVGLLLEVSTATAVHAAVAAGPVGGALLLLGQVAYLPNLVVWSASVLAGPGTQFGDAHLALGGSTVLDVPAVPLLAAMPDPGPFPLWTFAGPLTVVLAGALAGWYAHRHPSSRGATVPDRLVDSALVAALAGLAATGVAWLAGGSLGPWQPLGPDALMVGGAVAGEVLLGAVLVGGALHLLAGRPIRRSRRTG